MESYRLTEDAEADLIRIHQWGVRNYGVEKADEYYSALFDCFELISDQPQLYPSVDHLRPGYRRCVCGADSIYYRIDGDSVEIMRIIGQQDLDQVF